MENTDEKIGVFICHCGGNISDNVDIEKLKKEIGSENIRIFDHEYLCSNPGQQVVKDAIREYSLDRIVIGSCTPSKHETTFQKCLEDAGLNPSLLEIANLREQCSWVHPNQHSATSKAKSVLFSKIARIRHAVPAETVKIPINPTALVIGGGISGINAALNLAKSGVHTYLVEQDVTIGGKAAKIGKIFSPEKLAEECAMCSLSPLMNEVASHPNIELYTNCEVVDVTPTTGNFGVSLLQKPRYVTDACVSCGKCAAVCPVSVENDFNCGIKDKKAISLRFAQAVPQQYSIDPSRCIQLNGGECGRCQNVCNAGAIDFNQLEQEMTLDVGSIVTATGFDEYDPSRKPQYGYGRFPNVMTQMELARMLGVNGPTGGKLLRPSDYANPKNVVMIQCVGSRDEKASGNRYCSRYCCMAALKHASLIRKKFPDVNVTICYIDIRAFGLYENYYRAVQEMGVNFIRGRPAEIAERKDRSLVVKVEDTLTRQLKEIPADLVVLSTAMEASEGTKNVARMLNASLSEDGFIKERHSKLKPVDTFREGVFVCGTAQSPKDITDSIAQAGLAASRAYSFISQHEISIDPRIATIDDSACNQCGECMKCPFGAIHFNGDRHPHVDPLSCNGCGYCVSLCQSRAINITGYSCDELIAEVDAIVEEGDVLVFASRNIAYATIDNIGNSSLTYPSTVKIVRVPTTVLITKLMVDRAFRLGASSVMFVEEPTDDQIGEMIYPLSVLNYKNITKELGEDGSRVYLKKAYIPNCKSLNDEFTILAAEKEMLS